MRRRPAHARRFTLSARHFTRPESARPRFRGVKTAGPATVRSRRECCCMEGGRRALSCKRAAAEARAARRILYSVILHSVLTAVWGLDGETYRIHRARARQPRPTSASHAGIAASAMARRPRARSVGAGRRRADPTFGGTGFRWSAQRLAKQKCVQPVEQTGAHNGWRNRSLGIGTRWFTDSCFRRFETALRNQTGPPAMVPAGAQVRRYGGNRALTQRGKRSLSDSSTPSAQPPRHAVFSKRASVAPKTRRGTGWPRALAASPQALRVRRCVPSKGAGGRGGGSGRRPSWRAGRNPFFDGVSYRVSNACCTGQRSPNIKNKKTNYLPRYQLTGPETKCKRSVC